MTWRDDMRPASFRGVRFFVKEARTVYDTKAAVNEFPQRGTPEASTEVVYLGAPSRTFPIDAYLASDDYMERRDALEAALIEPSYGRLVHPYRGERTVAVVGKISTTERPAEGGKCRITFSCFDVTDGVGLGDSVDTAALAEADLDAAIADLAAEFGDTYAETTDGLSDIYEQASQSAWEDATDALRSANTEIAARISGIDDFATRVDAATFALDQLVRSPAAAASALMRAGQSIASIPDRIVNAVEQTAGTLRTLADDVVDSIRRSFFVDAFEREPIVVETANTQAEEQAARAVAILTRTTGVLAAARAAVTLPFVARGRALDLREELINELDTLIAEGPAGTGAGAGANPYQRLRAVRVSLSRHLESVAATLPEVSPVYLSEDESALALAWRIYGDAARADDIIARNAPSTPHRLPAGHSFEVLRT